MLKKIIDYFKDLIFPVSCIGCGKYSVWLCDNCLRTIRLNPDKDLYKIDGSNFDGVIVILDYEQELVKKLLHFYKYNFIQELSYYFEEITKKFLNNRKDFDFDLILPIPLSKKRCLFRGFNQVDVIADVACSMYNLDKGVNVLKRFYKRPQVGLNRDKRKKNIVGSFEVIEKETLKNKRVLLVDDVITTGATLDECSKIIKKAGAKQVFCLVLAKG